MKNSFTLQFRELTPINASGVSQGYRTTPSEASINFRKAQSTGYIFRSANDAIRDAKREAAAAKDLHLEPVKKRSRSADRDGDESMRDNSAHGGQESTTSATPQTLATRAIRPLRTSSQRALLQTRSMPVGAFGFSLPKSAQAPSKAEPVQEEEDWSEETTFAPVEQPFQPVEF